MTRRGCCCNIIVPGCWYTLTACDAFFGCDPDPAVPAYQVDCSKIPALLPGAVVVIDGICYEAGPSSPTEPGLPVRDPLDWIDLGYTHCDQCCPNVGCWYTCNLCPGSSGPTPVYITCAERDANPGKDAFYFDGACYSIGVMVTVLPGPVVMPALYYDDCTQCDPDIECCEPAACLGCSGMYTVTINGIDLTIWDPASICAGLLPCSALSHTVARSVAPCTWLATLTDVGGNCAGSIFLPCPGTTCGIQLNGPESLQIQCQTMSGGSGVPPRWRVLVQGTLMPDVRDAGGGFVCDESGLEPCTLCGPAVTASYISGPLGGACPCPDEVSYAVDQSGTSTWLWGSSCSVT